MYKHYLEAVFNAERKYLHTQLATHKFCLHLVFLEYRSHEWGTSQWSNSKSRTCWTSGAFGYWGLLYTTGSRWSTLRKKIESNCPLQRVRRRRVIGRVTLSKTSWVHALEKREWLCNTQYDERSDIRSPLWWVNWVNSGSLSKSVVITCSRDECHSNNLPLSLSLVSGMSGNTTIWWFHLKCTKQWVNATMSGCEWISEIYRLLKESYKINAVS